MCVVDQKLNEIINDKLKKKIGNSCQLVVFKSDFTKPRSLASKVRLTGNILLGYISKARLPLCAHNCLAIPIYVKFIDRILFLN